MKKSKFLFKFGLLALIAPLMLITNLLKSQNPVYDLNWYQDVNNSDEFTSLDHEFGGVYYTNINTINWLVVNSSGWHGSSTANPNHYDGATCLLLNGSDLYAGTFKDQEYNGGIFKSTSKGPWSSLLNYAGTPVSRISVTSIAKSSSYIYVGIEGGIYRYDGSSYTELNPSSTKYNHITSIAVDNNSKVFAGIYGAEGGVFYSSNNGTSWSEVNSGLTNKLVTSILFISGSTIVAGTDGGGVFYSSNNGTSWSSKNGTTLTNLNIKTLLIDGSTLIVGTDEGVFYSSNYSSGSPTWASANSSGLTNTSITSLALISTGNCLVAGTRDGVFKCTNYQSSPSWSDISGSLPGSTDISSLQYDNSSSTLYMGVCPKWRVMDAKSPVSNCCGCNNPAYVDIYNDPQISNNVLELSTTDVNYMPWSNCQSSTGTIESYNANYGYGYNEINAKLPYSTNLDIFWPSFWPYYCANKTPFCYSHQEFDIVEPAGIQYQGTTNVFGYWQNTEICGGTGAKTVESSYTHTSPLYENYHKYAVEWLPDKMIFYFDNTPIYSAFGDYSIQGLDKIQISAGIADNYFVPGPGELPAYFYIDYLHYYKLRMDCGNSLSLLTTSSVNNYYFDVPAVKSDITFGNGSNSISLSSGTHYVFRAVDFFNIYGEFIIPSNTEFVLMPTPCYY